MGDLLKIAAPGGVFADAAAAGNLEEFPAVPSGFYFYLQEMRIDGTSPFPRVARFRFVMPALADKADFVAIEGDFEHVCKHAALPALTRLGEDVAQIIVSFADREVEFGVATPEATQYFEGFTVENETCIWEAF